MGVSRELSRMAAAALGLGGPVALGVVTGRPALGMLAAVGALAAAGVSPPPGLRATLTRSACTTAVVAAAGFAGAAVAGRGWVTALAVVLLAGAAAVVGGLSRPVAELTTRFITFMVIMTGAAKGADPIAVAVLLAEGAAWGLLLAALLSRVTSPEGGSGADDPARAVAAHADDPAQEVAAHAKEPARAVVVHPEKSVRAPSPGALVRRWWRTLRTARGWRYPARLTACLAAAQVIGLVWTQPTASWISVTVVIVVRRRFDGAPRRAVERAAGTAAGVLAGAAVLLWVPPSWLFVLVVGVLAALRPMLKDRNGTLYAAVMTPLVLLLMDGVSAATIGYRLADTAVGCALALGLGYLPWAARSRGDNVRSARAVVE
ncbi:FUSC family protein [Nonomuraea sp. NPDC000554]|uniref:FUSC family protein n=1 Tax=Nonomuraea sp. NPDC000554 TaxID=3154259 RepID=UPI00332FC2F5